MGAVKGDGRPRSVGRGGSIHECMMCAWTRGQQSLICRIGMPHATPESYLMRLPLLQMVYRHVGALSPQPAQQYAQTPPMPNTRSFCASVVRSACQHPPSPLPSLPSPLLPLNSSSSSVPTPSSSIFNNGRFLRRNPSPRRSNFS